MHKKHNVKRQSNDQQVSKFDPTKDNAEAIARIEEEALRSRSLAERVSDTIVRSIGTITFVMFHILLFAVWCTVNLNLIPGVKPFDPFPFGILTLIVSAEGVLLAIFILISQNRMTRQTDRRAQLDLQINMLAEQELTMILQMQQSIYRHLGLDSDKREETQKLAEKTDVQELESKLEEKLPKEE